MEFGQRVRVANPNVAKALVWRWNNRREVPGIYEWFKDDGGRCWIEYGDGSGAED